MVGAAADEFWIQGNAALQAAVDLLHQSGATVTGALLTRVNVRQQARYGYGDSSDYFHYYRT